MQISVISGHSLFFRGSGILPPLQEIEYSKPHQQGTCCGKMQKEQILLAIKFVELRHYKRFYPLGYIFRGNYAYVCKWECVYVTKMNVFTQVLNHGLDVAQAESRWFDFGVFLLLNWLRYKGQRTESARLFTHSW